MAGSEPSAAARPFMGFGFAEFAHDALLRSGETGLGAMSREAVLHRSLHGTSDFPSLLTGAGQRTLAGAYQTAASPLKALAQRVTASDFRQNDILAIGGLGTLAEVTEHGEITATSTAEAKESWQLKTFGRTFGLTRKALTNDDLGAFGRTVTELGKAAAETENAALAALLLGNPTMGDGIALFHADHGNLSGTGDFPGEGPLSAARLAMRSQTGSPASASASRRAIWLSDRSSRPPPKSCSPPSTRRPPMT
jgi:phage major head subunit gpT-like protein